MTLITPQLALGSREDPARFATSVDAFLCCAREVPLFPGKPGHHLRLDDGYPVKAADLQQAFHFWTHN